MGISLFLVIYFFVLCHRSFKSSRESYGSAFFLVDLRFFFGYVLAQNLIKIRMFGEDFANRIQTARTVLLGSLVSSRSA